MPTHNHNEITEGYIWDFITSGNVNNPPEKPLLSGSNSGKVGTSYMYSAISTDIDDDKLYYKFDWGDGTDSDWIGTFNSDEFCNESHIWSSEGTFVVRVKAKDVKGAESDWSSFEVTMPRNKSLFDIFNNYLRFIQIVTLLFS